LAKFIISLATFIKKFIGNIGLMVVLNFLIKPVWLVLDNKVQDSIGHEDYGIFAALFSLSFLLATLSDFGINQYVTKKLAGEPDKIEEVFPVALGFKLLLMLLYPLFMTVVGYAMGYGWQELYFLWLLSIFQASIQLVMFFRANFQAHQKFFVDSFASIIDKFLLIIFLLVVFQIHISVESFIYARVLSILATVVLVYIFYVATCHWHRPSLRWKELFPLIQYSLPFAMVTVLYSFNERVDQVMIERLLGGRDSGLYAGAYRWLDAVMMYLWIVLPMFFARFAFMKNDEGALDKTFKIGHVIAFLPMAFISGFVFLYPEKLFILFEHSSAEEIEIMSNVLRILFLASLMHGMFAIYSTLLTSIGYEKQTSVLILVSVLCNIVLNLILVPLYGIYASAWATVASTAFLSAGYIVYICRYRLVKIPVLTILKLSLTFFAFMAFYYGLTLTSMTWYVNTAIAALFLGLMSWLLGLLHFKEPVIES
jgi:O-antigen/teichoic acid export membrane protein